MSSEEDNDQLASGSKKRRIQRACDVCRRKKIRCDGPQISGSKCSNCAAYDFECTYNEAARKRGPPKGYVESLETRLEKMEALLAKVCPDADFATELGGRFDKETWLRNRTASSSSRPATKEASPAPISFPSPSGLGDPDELYESDEEHPTDLGGTLSERLQRLEINPTSPRFIGKSSDAGLVHSAIALKSEFTGGPDVSQFGRNLAARRPEFWNIAPWEKRDIEKFNSALQNIAYTFPPDDLIPLLVQKYFDETNILTPLLHRPTFDKDLADRLHLRDRGFGLVLLVVCAIGARFVDDERVRLDGEGGHSAGWKWFNQIQMVRKSLWAAPRLYDIQVLALAAMFLSGSSAPQACWSIVGIGIRYAQDVGAHRKKVYGPVPTTHEELWKRAFWVLVSCDRGLSCMLGRPPAIQDEDFDAEMPIECDDQYWTHTDPQMTFKQPPTIPSSMSYFICTIKLNQILAFAMRTVYSISKSRVSLGFVGPNWEQNVVSDLDSALNRWIDSVPDHLRWDPNREDELFFHQSASLYAYYYLTQIVVHRPYIPTPGKQSPLSYSSLAICTNAARSCSHVLDIHQKRLNRPLPYSSLPAFTAGIVLLLNVWGGKQAGGSPDFDKEMKDVHKCMEVMKNCESRWHSAGRFRDVLCELTSVGDLPLPFGSPKTALKRDRSEDSEADISPPSSTGTVDASQPRTVAGSRRAAAGGSSQRGTLPVRTEDLGRMPLHPSFPSAAPTASSEQWQAQMSQQQHLFDGLGTQAVESASPPWNADPAYEEMMRTMFNPTSPGSGPGYAPPHGPSAQSILNSDTLAMWSTAPSGFELDEWGSYLTEMSGLGGHNQANGHGQSGMLP